MATKPSKARTWKYSTMKSEQEVRDQWRDKKQWLEETEKGNKDFQEGYVFALEWVLGSHEDDEAQADK